MSSFVLVKTKLQLSFTLSHVLWLFSDLVGSQIVELSKLWYFLKVDVEGLQVVKVASYADIDSDHIRLRWSGFTF